MYCYDITEQSTCLSNVPDEASGIWLNVVAYVISTSASEPFLEAASRSDCVKAVSYTHLDVYKRQVLETSTIQACMQTII